MNDQEFDRKLDMFEIRYKWIANSIAIKCYVPLPYPDFNLYEEFEKLDLKYNNIFDGLGLA